MLLRSEQLYRSWILLYLHGRVVVLDIGTRLLLNFALSAFGLVSSRLDLILIFKTLVIKHLQFVHGIDKCAAKSTEHTASAENPEEHHANTCHKVFFVYIPHSLVILVVVVILIITIPILLLMVFLTTSMIFAMRLIIVPWLWFLDWHWRFGLFYPWLRLRRIVVGFFNNNSNSLIIVVPWLIRQR